MEKILSQEEINALLQASREAGGDPDAPGKPFSPYVFGKASRISKQQVRDVAQLHESFTFSLKNRLSAHLQVIAEINPMTVDELQYAEFLESIPPKAYLASINVKPANVIAILSLDLPIALAMIDLMLGGDGKPAATERPTTEIEEKVLQIVIDMICEELQRTWREVMEVDFSFDQTQRAPDLFRLMPPYEKILFLSFEIRIPEVFSTLTLAFPAAASSLFLRKLAKKHARSQTVSLESRLRLQEILRECIFGVQMLLPPTRMLGEDLLSIEAGETILIQHRIGLPALLMVAGCKMFSGHPVRNGTQRSAMIQEKFRIQVKPEKVSA
ncbi:MAG: flagellar motor switch protein FliM [Terriglobia bacterium]